MLVANFVTNRAMMGLTATYEDFWKALGAKPHKLGIMAKLYPDLTASFLTESLFNIYTKDASKKKNFESIDAYMFDWEVETNYIKYVEFADTPKEDGTDGSDITFAFKERYFEKYDIFMIMKSRQQVIVTQRPVRKADNYWEVTGRLIDNDYQSILDVNACQIGDLTRWQSNAHPEMSEEGYIKYLSNVEHHRNFMSYFRNDASFSSLYGAMEDVFISIAEGTCKEDLHGRVYKMNKIEKDLNENFMYARNNGLLFNKTNVDVNGKATISDPDTGRPIVIGDGMIPQIERYASKYAFNRLTPSVLTTAMGILREKSNTETGNEWICVCNMKFWDEIQLTLSGWLANFRNINGTYLWSKASNGYVDVGATFQSYEFAGNVLSFKVDRSLTHEYGDQKAFALMIDLTADKADGKPAIAMYTIKNGDYIMNTLEGVGRLTGTQSGPVASPVAASKLIATGYAGIGVFSPYRSCILQQV